MGTISERIDLLGKNNDAINPGGFRSSDSFYFRENLWDDEPARKYVRSVEFPHMKNGSGLLML